MPVIIPVYDETTDELVSTEYFTMDEVGEMLPVHPNTIRRYVREGRWPCLRIGNVSYMSRAMVGEAVESLHQRVGPISETPPKLGTPLPAPETESIR